GFYFTSNENEPLIYRPKPVVDEAMPAGNGMLARVLGRLGHLMADTRYLDVAGGILGWAAPSIARAPAAHCTMLAALEDHLYPPELAVIRGEASRIEPWLAACRKGYKPWRMSFGIPTDARGPDGQPPILPPYLPKLQAAGDVEAPVAYVCSGLTCSLPIRDLEDLEKALT
ncbi:MAG: thioredoxin domain-containing protein, partial [Gammaproteobacteria bacterium]